MTADDDDRPDPAAFKIADDEIGKAAKRLHKKKIAGRYVAEALLLHAMDWALEEVGDARVVLILETLIDQLHARAGIYHDSPPPPQTRTH
jgi:hypothetical protein